MDNSGTPASPRLDMSAWARDGIIVAELAGELDISSAPALREQLLGLLRQGSSRLIIDLSGVTFCDASGLAVLVGAGHRARLLGGFLRLAAVSSPADRILHLTGLSQHLPSFPTVSAAAASPPGALPSRTGATTLGGRAARPGPGGAGPAGRGRPGGPGPAQRASGAAAVMGHPGEFRNAVSGVLTRHLLAPSAAAAESATCLRRVPGPAPGLRAG